VGGSLTESRSYDAANQVSGGSFTYDAAGNLTNG
jgi:hypothetical protein